MYLTNSGQHSYSKISMVCYPPAVPVQYDLIEASKNMERLQWEDIAHAISYAIQIPNQEILLRPTAQERW